MLVFVYIYISIHTFSNGRVGVMACIHEALSKENFKCEILVGVFFTRKIFEILCVGSHLYSKILNYQNRTL